VGGGDVGGAVVGGGDVGGAVVGGGVDPPAVGLGVPVGDGFVPVGAVGLGVGVGLGVAVDVGGLGDVLAEGEGLGEGEATMAALSTPP
jgi:hypothetical protein